MYQNYTIQIINDIVVENDEMFFLKLISTDINVNITQGDANVTIVSDDKGKSNIYECTQRLFLSFKTSSSRSIANLLLLHVLREFQFVCRNVYAIVSQSSV
jgi:hypothetical protein